MKRGQVFVTLSGDEDVTIAVSVDARELKFLQKLEEAINEESARYKWAPSMAVSEVLR